MPDSSVLIRAPLSRAADIPPQQRITRPTLPRNPSRLQFREMGLEETNLVLSVDGGSVFCIIHDAEMVLHSSLVDCCCGLRDELGSAHGLAVLEGGAV
jgi:hypothetical protein